MATETTGIEAVQDTGKPATPASPPSQGPVPTGLLSDPTASALHDAFLIGWSLTELRSRIQTEIKDGYDFLTTVIWTEEERSQEIERIAQAAFGPLGALVGAQLLPGRVKYRDP